MMKTLLLLSLCGLAFSLQCYDCNPDDENRCIDPEKHNIKKTHCDADVTNARKLRNPFINIIDGTEKKECFTIYFRPTGTSNLKEGIYRGCADKTENCKYVNVPGDVTCYQNCSEDDCNTGNGTSSLGISLFSMFVSYLLRYCI